MHVFVRNFLLQSGGFLSLFGLTRNTRGERGPKEELLKGKKKEKIPRAAFFSLSFRYVGWGFFFSFSLIHFFPFSFTANLILSRLSRVSTVTVELLHFTAYRSQKSVTAAADSVTCQID